MSLEKLWLLIAIGAGAAFKKFFGDKKKSSTEDNPSQSPA
jgi:hypothetical protein